MKQLITILFVTVLSISCNKQTSKHTDATENQKIVKAYFQYFNRHEWKKLANMYAEISDFKDPSLGQRIVRQTRQQIEEKYAGLCELFPDLYDEVISIYPSGKNHIIVEFVSSGKPVNGPKFELLACTIFTIENGKITKDFTYYDNFEDQQQK